MISNSWITLVLLNSILTIFLGCSNKLSKYNTEVTATQKLIKKIVEWDTNAVKEMIGVDPYEIGLSDEKINSAMHAINNAIKKSDVRDSKDYQIREYSNQSPNLVDIIVPIEEGADGNSYVIVSFVKYIKKGKVFNFELIKPIPKNLDDLPPPENLIKGDST